MHTLAQKYLDVTRLRTDRGHTKKADLRADVKAFEKASPGGEFYDSFDVNSKNFREGGTMKYAGEGSLVLDAQRFIK